jgi:CubicO group peptidase (beta-lactamase class C family)
MPGGMIYHADNWNDYPPGEGIYYSSIGFDLLAFIVERVSSIPFETYCKQYIFDPMQMWNSSYSLQDVPLDQFTTIYGYLLGVHFSLPYYEIINDGSGGVYTTIEDISHFLRAHMNNGTYDSVQILSPESIHLMHTPQTLEIPAYDIYKDGRKHGLGWIVWPDENLSYEHGLQGHLGNVPGGLASMTVMNQNGVVFFGNEWLRISYSQTFIMKFLRDYFHTKVKTIDIEGVKEYL